MDKQFDVIIIGAGPAGLTAAIYASRADLKVLIIEADAPGGKLVKTEKIENYPSYPQINGVDLAIKLMEHGLSFGSQMISAKVKALVDKGQMKEVILENGQTYQAKTVIVATGTKERELDVPLATKYFGHGISYCAVCDGAFYKDKEVVVVGGGNSALQEAIYLASLAKKVTIVIRKDVFRAEAALVDLITANEKIEVVKKHIPSELVIENDKIVALQVKDVDSGELMKIACQGIFPYIGANPASEFMGKEALNEQGYLKVDEDMATVIPGVFGAGDVIEKHLRQVVTATGDGAIAANSAIKYIQNH